MMMMTGVGWRAGGQLIGGLAAVILVAACADATQAPGASGLTRSGPVSSAPVSSGTDSSSGSTTSGAEGGALASNEVFTLLASDAPRSSDAAPADSARDALSGFGIDLLRQVVDAEPNTVVSPYSLYSVLAMVRAGAAGETARQLDEVLRADGDEGSVMVAVDRALASATAEDGIEIDRANQVWIQDDFQVNDNYLDALAEDYGADAVVAAFADAPERVREAINAWVADRTYDLIPDLFPEGSIDAGTRLALVNALYLKAGWLLPFHAPEKSHPFVTADGATVETPLMSAVTELDGVVGNGWTSVTIPYEGGGLAMTLLVPDEGTYDAVLADLDADLLGAATGGIASDEARPIRLSMPPFTVRSGPDVLTAMKELGVTDLFDPDRADLSGVTGDRSLFVAALVHQAVISVDQHGTEAAAASGATMVASSAPANPIELTVDRPFLYWIADTTTGAPLFLGTVTNPTV